MHVHPYRATLFPRGRAPAAPRYCTARGGGCARGRDRRGPRSSCRGAGRGPCRGRRTCGTCASWAPPRREHLPQTETRTRDGGGTGTRRMSAGCRGEDRARREKRNPPRGGARGARGAPSLGRRKAKNPSARTDRRARANAAAGRRRRPPRRRASGGCRRARAREADQTRRRGSRGRGGGPPPRFRPASARSGGPRVISASAESPRLRGGNGAARAEMRPRAGHGASGTRCAP